MEDELTLLDYWQVVVKWKKLIIPTVAVVTVSSALISLSLTKVFRAEATIMPVGGQKSNGLALMASGQMSGLLGDLVPSSSAPQIMAVLKSRTLAERMIEKYDLMKILFEEKWDKENQKWKTEGPDKIPNMEEAAKRLSSRVSMFDDKKSQLIAIRVEMPTPALAADVANGYLKELAIYVNENTLTVAKRNRIFIEAQLERNKSDLLKSGKELNEFYTVNKISNVVPMVDVDISVEPEEIQKKVLETESIIQKTKIVKGVPQQVYLQYLSLRRELLGKMNALLTQQYEMAKIEEAKEDLNFQVIDKARVPFRKFKPKRAQIVIITFFMSLMLTVFYAFFVEHLRKLQQQRR